MVTGTGTEADFRGQARGDLDCDGVLSTFRRRGWIDPNTGDVTGARAAEVVNELE